MHLLRATLLIAALASACSGSDPAAAGGSPSDAGADADAATGDGATDAPAGDADEGGDAPTGDADEGGDAPADGGDAAACPVGEKRCAGACVLVSDPDYGCTTTGCDPCVGDHVLTFACSPPNPPDEGSCRLEQCAPDYYDCDQDPSRPACAARLDGTLPAAYPHCGVCGTLCVAPEACLPDSAAPYGYSCQ